MFARASCSGEGVQRGAAGAGLGMTSAKTAHDKQFRVPGCKFQVNGAHWEPGTGNWEPGSSGSDGGSGVSELSPPSPAESLTYTNRPLNPHGVMPLYGKMTKLAFPPLDSVM